MLFDNKVGLVTAAAAGIGEAIAKELASEGASVVVSDIDVDNGRRVVDEISSAGGVASFFRCDVSRADEVDGLVRHAVQTHGGLHLAVNNAGLGHHPAPLHEIPLETWDKLIAVNLRGVLLCLREELSHMLAHGGGAIVNVASGTGLKASPGLAAYVATKHGVVGLTRNAGLDYAKQGIRVNAVAPGTVATPQMLSFPQAQQEEWVKVLPMERFGTAEEIAEAVAFLLSDKASFITGTVIEVDGGYMQGSRGQ